MKIYNLAGRSKQLYLFRNIIQLFDLFDMLILEIPVGILNTRFIKTAELPIKVIICT